jgi:predicted DNA repair protein MutK
VAAASLLTLINDISVILDDVSVMAKVAAKKTAGVVGDDLALNAGQVTGVNAERELPVVWAVAKGSFKNKVILIPAALAISAIAPWAITPLLMLGGIYLCYEGSEKIAEKVFHEKHENHSENALDQLHLTKEEHDALEKEKIDGAITTDFVLSAEIIVIALGAAASGTLAAQALILCAVGIAITVGVYGLVAGIVKADDVGLHLMGKSSSILNNVGKALVYGMPKFMKVLAVLGTVAMFTVGGSILAHGIPAVHHLIDLLPAQGLGHSIGAVLVDIGVGLTSGIIAVVTMHFLQNPIEKIKHFLRSFKSTSV